MGEDATRWWDEAYDEGAPWDTGRPQPAIEDLVESGLVRGRVLDVGCGTGTHARHLAARGHPVTAVDFSARAVELARLKADERALDVTVRRADALDLDPSLGPFETVVDTGLFHTFEPAERTAYATSLARVLEPGGRVFVLAFSDRIDALHEDAPDGPGAPMPNLVSPPDFEAAFADGWRIEWVREEPFETSLRTVPGYLASVVRDGGS